MLSADSDDRVDPDARAQVRRARCRRPRSGEAPVLLRIERNAGHGGADMVKAAVEKTADSLAFALAQVAGDTPIATAP